MTTLPDGYLERGGPHHWSLWPRNRELYETRPEYRRLFDEWDGKLAPEPDPTPEEVALARTCEHLDPCATGCRMNLCKAGHSPRRSGEVAILDCVRCPITQARKQERPAPS